MGTQRIEPEYKAQKVSLSFAPSLCDFYPKYFVAMNQQTTLNILGQTNVVMEQGLRRIEASPGISGEGQEHSGLHEGAVRKPVRVGRAAVVGQRRRPRRHDRRR